MKKEPEFCKPETDNDTVRVVYDVNQITVPWVCAGLGYPPDSLRVLTVLAFMRRGKLLGALLFHDGYAAHDVWWTIYTVDKRWCQRHTLRRIFEAAFIDMKCRRIGIMVQEDNEKSLKLVRRLGFQEEGRLRQLGKDGQDCIVFSMLKDECRFL